jgi:septum formation protein
VLVLASSSSYRRLLLDRLRVPYSVAVPAVDESALPGEKPGDTACRLAELKARAVAADFPGAIIIGSDQVASLGEVAIGKPGDHDSALAQLMAMRGERVVFHTALCVLDAGRNEAHIQSVPTTVHFRDYTEAQATHYLQIDRPYDCAGSAKIESLGIALVSEVVSTDPTALVGLPLVALVGMLQHTGIEVL